MILLALYSLSLLVFNVDYLTTIDKEQKAGAEWHYVGPQAKDPKAKQFITNNTVYFKLKHPDEK